MQAGQDRDRGAGIHCQDVRWRKVPAEIQVTMRDHIGYNTRIFGVRPVQVCFCCVYIADIGKALGAQQFLKS
jgi:hypothetical protein